MTKILISLLAVLPVVAGSFAQEASISRNSNLRSVPSPDGKIAGHLPAGTAVTVISKYPRSGYVRVETSEGETGWVYQRNTAIGQATATTVASEPKKTLNEIQAARIGDLAIYPKAQFTPGEPDPSVTQGNIAKNICKVGWSTDSVRPSDSVTNKIKTETMQSYGFTDAANHYELDHLVSLQNGGCPDCVENLWPEAYGDQSHPMTQDQRSTWNKQHPGSNAVLPGALEKDVVENHVHDEICFGIPQAKMSAYAKKYPATISLPLKRGQQILATDWYACYQNMMDGNRPCE